MTEHTVRSFGEELEVLASEVSRMGGLAEHLLVAALDAVVRRDTARALAVVERDQLVDEMQRELERRARLMLALRQPLAQDLRHTLAALKISAHLERVGDLSKNIAKRTLVINESDPLPVTRGVDRMGRMVAANLKDVLDAYIAGDADRAAHVWRSDEEIDQHHETLFRDLLALMAEDSRLVDPCAHFLFVAKNLERIGDHATNIAEVVHYLVTGEELPRARPKRESAPVAAILGDDGP